MTTQRSWRTRSNQLGSVRMPRSASRSAADKRAGSGGFADTAALAGRGIVPDTPSLTAGECRQAVAGGLPGAYPVVAKATIIFESVMYGRAEATAGGVDTLAAAERSVKAA